MLATISEFLETSYPTYEAGESRKSEFSVLPLFPLPPYQHLFYHSSTAISTQILCGSEISINGPVHHDMFLILETDSTRHSN